ncbi:hypothetical protein ACW2QC_10100 [Virgibacillus sp. FSP13]
MDETYNSEEAKKGFSKKIIAIIVAALLVVGGGVTAYVLITGSDKAQYFTAEKNTIEFMKERINERYQSEFDWRKQTEENPTEAAVELSANYNDPTSGGYGMMNPQEIINNSSLTLTTQTDLQENKVAADIQANLGEMEIGDINLFLDADKVMLGLPFLQETLQLKDRDLGKLLHEADPTFPKDETIDFNSFFEMAKGLPEDDQEYLTEEYITTIYDEIPDEAFDSSDETVKVDKESFDTKKITLHLSEQKVKDILSTTLKKAKDDKRLKKIITEQMEIQQFGLSSEFAGVDIDQEIKNFEKGLDEAIKGLKDAHIPKGLTSIIWVKNDLIVKRDFTIGAGPNKDDIGTLTITGTHLLNDETQKFDYEFTAGDATNKESMTLTGDLSWKNNKADDTIKLVAGNTEISYDGTETLKDGKRDYERVFSINSPDSGTGSLNWSGVATYDNDKMNSENTFSVEAPGITQDMFSLHVAKDAKTIKKVEAPDDSSVKDLGSMSVNEIMQYFESDVMPQYQQWLMGILGAGGGLNGL